MTTCSTPESALPPLYARWVDDLLGGPIPAEKNATCHDCAMCAGPEPEQIPGQTYFSPEVKCCTFWPVLPNYLVGRILEDDSTLSPAVAAMAAGKRIKGEIVTPLGILSPARYHEQYHRHPEGFGRDPSRRCPFLVDVPGQGNALCGVWRNRQAVCATWYCRYDRGLVGLRFWNDTRLLLLKVEEALRWWCVLEAGLPEAALRRLAALRNERTGYEESATGSATEAGLDEGELALVWGAWRGREAEFFRECGRRVAPLSWTHVEGIGGATVALAGALLRQAHAALLSRELPERLAAQPFRVHRVYGDRASISADHSKEAIEVPQRLLPLLACFEGQPVDESIARVEREHGIVLRPGLLRKLADYGILAQV